MVVENNLKKQFKTSMTGAPLEIVSPECLGLGIHSITISPSDASCLNDVFEETEVEHFVQQWKAIFIRMKNKMDLIMEYSKTGRFHWHGNVQITDRNMFYLNDLVILSKYASVNVDTIDDLQDWCNYCFKNTGDMEQLTERYRLPYRWSSYKAPLEVKQGYKHKRIILNC